MGWESSTCRILGRIQSQPCELTLFNQQSINCVSLALFTDSPSCSTAAIRRPCFSSSYSLSCLSHRQIPKQRACQSSRRTPSALHAPSNAPCTHSPRPRAHSGAPAQPEACNSARAPWHRTTLSTGKSASVSCENVKSFTWTSLRNRLNLTRCYLWCFSSLQVHRTPPLAGKPRGGGCPLFFTTPRPSRLQTCGATVQPPGVSYFFFFIFIC